MAYLGDYHVHSVYSHGKQTIAENAARARELGLKQIAITDHGLRHVVFGLRRWKLEEMRKEIAALKDPGVEVLLGVEANLIGREGQVDLEEGDYEELDVIVCNFHKAVWAASAGDFFKFFVPNLWADGLRLPRSDKRVRENTRALVQAVKKHKIDIISHISYAMTVDCEEVAKVCADYGTMIELSGKKISYTDEEFQRMADTGVTFIMDSDAHSVDRVCDFKLAEDLVRRTGYPFERIANVDKLPKFRSKTT